MTIQALTLNVPGALYERLKRRAEQTNRTVEDETLDVLAAAVPLAEALPTDLAEATSSLALLDDEALWRAAHNQLPDTVASRIAELHRKRQREALTDEEAQELPALIRQYERVMLIRAQAAALLHQRGHDVTALATPT